ncbi:MAG: protein kinase [Abyssibacter sp.]|uniref:protein kinase domain-containing protein n=1 Tax=Abyssibacter sp. TaxID=2320200 RepID=UPI00321AEDA9
MSGQGTTAERWARVSALFDAAWELPETEREHWLQTQASDDPDLLDEVRLLLAEADTQQAGDELLLTGAAQRETPVFQPLIPNTRVGPWAVQSLLGRGGMGEVYEVQRIDGSFEQRAALKVVTLQSPAAIVRFHAERRILATLDHPGIARILDGGTLDDGRPYMVMEYVEGESMTQYCQRRQLDLRQRIALFLDACDALAHAHSRLVVHRDIKPGNLFVTEAGRVKLLDFGIAKILGDAVDEQTRTQLVLTPVYAAPEQLANRAVGTPTDVYSMGALLYHLLTGRPPADAETSSVSRLISQVLDGQFPKASTATRSPDGVPATQLAGDLDAILERCLRREPDARYPGIDALADDLRAYLSHRPVTARAGSRAYRVRQFFRRYAWQTVAVGCVILTLLAGTVTSLWFAHQAQVALVETQAAKAETEDALARAEQAAASARTRAKLRTQLTEAFVRLLGEAQSAEQGGEQVLAFLDDQRRSAMARQAEGSRDAEALLIALGEVFVQRGDAPTVIETLQAMAEDPNVLPRNRAGANALIGSAYANMGELDAAVEPLQKALTYYREEPGFDIEYAQHLGLLAHAKRDPDTRRQANAVIRRVLAAAPEPGDLEPKLRGFLHSQVGFNLLRLGELEAAEGEMLQAVAAYEAEEGATPTELGLILTNLGGAQYRLGKLEAAADTFRRSIAFTRQTAGTGRPLANAQRFLASMLIKLGEHAEALALLDEVTTTLEQQGLNAGALYFVALNTRTRALLASGQVDEARAHAERVITAIEDRRPDDAANVGSAYYELANVQASQNQTAAALATLTRSDTIFEALGERRDQAMARNNALRSQLAGSAETNG